MSAPAVTEGVLDRILCNNRFLESHAARRFRRLVDAGSGPLPGSYEIRVATRVEEILEQLGLRHRSYVSHDYLDPTHTFEGQLEFDRHDVASALFIARNRGTGELHAAARLAFPLEGRLPMEEYYSLEAFRQRIGYSGGVTLVEFSRLLSHPTGQKELNRALVRTVFEFAVDQGVDYILGAGRCDIRRYYDKWGFRDVEPGLEIDLRGCVDTPLCSPIPVYPHYMHVSEIRWEKI